MTNWDPDDLRIFDAFAPTTALLIGPHNIFTRNGIAFNDRSELDCYWVEDPVGFDSTDLNIGAQDNGSDEGELPDDARRPGRTMTLNGYIQAGTYPKMLEMARALLDSLVSSKELPMAISAHSSSSIFLMPDVFINCRLAASPSISMKIEQNDLTGIFRRAFSISFRASTDPGFLAAALRSYTMIPTVVGARGRVYPRRYPLTYDTYLDSTNHPLVLGGGANSVVVQNDGNANARGTVRFTGPLGRSILTNQDTGERIIIRYPIPAGEYIEVDLAKGTAVNRLGELAGSFIDMKSDMLTIPGKVDGGDGSSTLILTTESYDAGAQVDIWFRDRWL